MNKQKQIVDSYIAQLGQGDDESVIYQALHDPTLFIFSPILLAIGDTGHIPSYHVLRVFANQTDVSPDVEEILRSDPTLLRKYIMLDLVSRAAEQGFKYSFDALRWYCENDWEVVQFWLEMRSIGLVDVPIDERNRTVRFTDIFIPREINIFDAENILRELEHVVGQMQEQAGEAMRDVRISASN